jgi:DNA-binding GntR family transcriptional regulator
MFPVERAVSKMSDRDIEVFEHILIEAMAALQLEDVKTYAIRDRGFYEAIAEQCGNSTSPRHWHGLHFKSSSVAQLQM